MITYLRVFYLRRGRRSPTLYTPSKPNSSVWYHGVTINLNHDSRSHWHSVSIFAVSFLFVVVLVHVSLAVIVSRGKHTRGESRAPEYFRCLLHASSIYEYERVRCRSRYPRRTSWLWLGNRGKGEFSKLRHRLCLFVITPVALSGRHKYGK